MRNIVAIRSTVLIATAVVLATAAHAQQKQPSPEEMQKIMDATMGAMVPMMGRMTEAMIEAQLVIAERSSTAERIAVFKKNLYDALLKKGFSPEQAIQITVATSTPSATPGTK